MFTNKWIYAQGRHLFNANKNQFAEVYPITSDDSMDAEQIAQKIVDLWNAYIEKRFCTCKKPNNLHKIDCGIFNSEQRGKL